MFINHIKLSTVRFLVNKNQLKKQILQKELQIKKLHLHQSSTEFCNQLYNTLILEKAILKKELENLEKNCILEKIRGYNAGEQDIAGSFYGSEETGSYTPLRAHET